jgi:RNA polymerase sigma-70 factor, ECF subfamily
MDNESFELHYRANYSKVYRLALGLAGNPHDAEEITQEAFVRALRAYGSFRGECSFFTWIYRIALNVCSRYLKRRAKMTTATLVEDLGYRMEDILDSNPRNDPETALLSREVRVKCLRGVAECLSGEQRRVFCLAITLGLPHRMVAEILECSTGKVKTTLYRARKKWFGYMENHCSLLSRSNPCRCEQWVRFALQQGWISRTEAASSFPALDPKVLSEVTRLKALSMLYGSLDAGEADEALCERIRTGMRRKEWAVLS